MPGFPELCLFCGEDIEEEEALDMLDDEGNTVHYNCAITEAHTCPTKEPQPPCVEANCPICKEIVIVCLLCDDKLLSCDCEVSDFTE